MGVRGDFYAGLRSEFDDGPSESFLFRFLRKERLTDEKKEDFARTTLDGLLELLADRNQKLRLNGEDQRWLQSLGERAGGRELREELELTRGDRARYRLILEALKGRPDAVTEQELDRLRGIVLDAAVTRDAWTFLYDAGFSPARQDGHPARKKDRVLEMLDVWCEETGRSLCQGGASGPDGLTDAERQAWNEMFRLLQSRTAPARVILPVRIDPRTGAGLYLVGTQHFTSEVRRHLKQRQRLNCVFMCLGPSDFIRNDIYQSVNINEKIYSDFYLCVQPLMDDKAYCVTLEDGERLFSHILTSSKNYSFFRDQNFAAPPGTPKMLLPYFQPVRQSLDPEYRELAVEGRAAFEQDAMRGRGPRCR